jgi:energy-coupling factor transport system permease protein
VRSDRKEVPLMGGILDYIPGNSLLHRLNPLSKVILSLVLCVSCFLTGNLFFALGVILINVLMGAVAGILPRSFRILNALVKLSLVLFVVQVLFVRSGHILLRLPLYVVITDEGITFSLLFCMRLIAATMPLGLMLSVTQMSDLTGVLVGKLGIPYRYTFVLTTAMRFIPIFSDEMADIMEAQIARGVDFDTRNFIKKIRLLLPLCVPLLISSVRRIDSGAIAAELRGFNFRKKGSGYREYPFKGIDFIALFCGAALIALAIFL